MKNARILFIILMLSCTCNIGNNRIMASFTPTNGSNNDEVDCFDVPHSICYGLLVTPDGTAVTKEYGSNYKIEN